MRKGYDERDTIFSRWELEPGTPRYEEYYRRHPEKKKADQELMSAKEGRFHHQILERYRMESHFKLIADLRSLVSAPAAKEKVDLAPQEIQGYLEKTAKDFGAIQTGGVETPEDWVYSYRGRGDLYGVPVENYLPYTFVFAMEMSLEEVNRAPAMAEAAEVSRVYMEIGLLGLALAYQLRSMGFEALTHMDGCSQLILPPVAERAGLGKIGRHGLLVHPQYGSRIRLGAVTTNLVLQQGDSPSFKLREFCETCRKCALQCPVQAIPEGPAQEGWQVDHEKCFSAWQEFGTDCGVCLAACPFSQGRKGRDVKPGSKDFLKNWMFENS